MKTTTLAVLLSVASLGAVAALYVKVDNLEEGLRLSRADRTDAGRGSSAAERPEYVIRNGDAGEAKRDAPAAPDANPPPAGESGEDAGSLGALSVEERLARLEKRDSARAGAWPSFETGRIPPFARSLDDLGKQLKLTTSQKDRVAEAVRRAKARIDDVLSIPGADGKTIKELREESRKRMMEAVAAADKNPAGILTLALSAQKRMNEKIPGRNETYRDEIQRIQKETRDEINRTLSPEQQEQFGDTNIDGLLGESGNRMTFATTFTSGDEEGEPGGAIMISEGVEIGTRESAPDKE